jgi:hypothetical protein
MSKLFEELKARLLHEGIAPRHIRRYLNELREHLEDLRAEEISAGHSAAEAESAALNRLGNVEELTMAMARQKQFSAWCKRAPWAVFGLAPVALLAVLYFLACVILLVGWRIFLPNAATPFGLAPHRHIYDLENIYFQAGKFFYYGAPVLAGWMVLLVAMRQKITSAWLMAGLLLLAGMGATNVVHANRTEVHSLFGPISMDFTSIYKTHGPDLLWPAMAHAAVILALTLLPYIVWKFSRRAYPASA